MKVKKKTKVLSLEDNNLHEDEIWILESNIDDSPGEALGFTLEKLIEEGAKDAFFTPVYMKKNRPAYKLTVLCAQEDIETMESIIFKNTTTIGIRKYKINRRVLKREILEMDTRYGAVRFKVCAFEGEKYYYPEYEDIKNICNETGLGFKIIYNEVQKIK